MAEEIIGGHVQAVKPRWLAQSGPQPKRWQSDLCPLLVHEVCETTFHVAFNGAALWQLVQAVFGQWDIVRRHGGPVQGSQVAGQCWRCEREAREHANESLHHSGKLDW